MPGTLAGMRAWIRDLQDAFNRGWIDKATLQESRRSMMAVGDLYRVGAEMRKAEAAVVAAHAQARLADTLAALEHGGAAVIALARLQESMGKGDRRRIPARLVPQGESA